MYRVLIQIVSVTGVWGITFIVILCNSVLALLIAGYIEKGESVRREVRYGILSLAIVLAISLGFGLVEISNINSLYESPNSIKEKVRLALIQQNTDPRKNDYQDTFDILRELTNEAVKYNPDMVVWSETAFVPNIRRWGKEDPKKYGLARLVREFFKYQRSLGVWLLTGNDDYLLTVDNKGREIRYDYNASVLFSYAHSTG
jgi:apolipoprotein N-acyltransferase